MEDYDKEIKFLNDQNVSGYYPIFLALLNAPSIIFDILPFIFLISSLILPVRWQGHLSH